MTSEIITQDYLKELFVIHPNGVDFVWKIATSRRINIGQIAGTPHARGYCIIRINGKGYLRSRLRWLFENGNWPKENIDHIDGNTSNDRIENLRECSQIENGQNLKIKKNNLSGFPGVTWYKPYNKWRVRIMSNGKEHHGGYFDNLEDAIAKAVAMKSELHQFNPVQRITKEDI